MRRGETVQEGACSVGNGMGCDRCACVKAKNSVIVIGWILAGSQTR